MRKKLNLFLKITIFIFLFFVSGCSMLSKTIIWQNYDGTILEVDLKVGLKETHSYDGKEPTRNEEKGITYSFSNWEKISDADNVIIYQAQYSSSINTYQVTFKNYDGTILDSEEYEYESIPSYKGDTPIKEATNEYTYTFDGWDKQISNVTSNAEYIATFTSTKNSYTITFKNYDGTILQSSGFEYGSTPTYNGITPTKDASVEYSYIFNGWDKQISNVTNNAEYIATFTNTKNSYTITFKNYDGTILDSEEYEYGSIPSYKGDTPIKEATNEYTYIFNGWDKQVSNVTCNTEYIATFTSTKNSYTITFKNYDGTILDSEEYEYGSIPSYKGDTPIKEATNEYTYIFNGWDKQISNVTSNAEYIATFASIKNSYTITFKNYDGTILQSSSFEYGSIPTYNGTTPIKESDEQYTYSFAGWTPDIVNVSKDETYTALFINTTNKYIATFKNYDGTILSYEALDYGEIPIYKGSTPLKRPTDEYSYIFVDWDKKISEVKSNIEYIATFKEVKNSYTVTFKNYDGTILESNFFEYGSIPSYNGTTPTKETTIEYSYIFVGWDKKISEVKSNIEYIATFKEAKNSYTVTFKNYDGSILSSQIFAYGEIPTYSGSTPSKPSDAEYSYTFNGWNLKISEVTSNTEYIATFKEAKNSYTITFKNYDGEVLASELYEYGSVPAYKGETPIKKATAMNTYSFIGWSPAIEAVCANATYVALFEDSTNKYIATFKNYDGSILYAQVLEYGEIPTYSLTTPIRPSTAEYSYAFIGWNKEIVAITCNCDYIATFSKTKNSYLVIFKNYDGSVLERSYFEYGSTPTYNGKTPTKDASAEYTYIFNGWDKQISNVTSNASYIATFTRTKNSYTITFKNYDGTILQSSSFEYGSTPTYNGASPTKDASAEYTYNFNGWDKQISNVTSNTEYIATFTSTKNSYTITFKNYDGTILQSSSYEYGSIPTYNGASPTKDASAEYTYIFNGWDKQISNVTSNTEYIATFTSTKNSYTIAFKNYDGTILQSSSFEYGSTPTYNGKTPIKESDEQYTYAFAGWNPNIVNVSKDEIYTALFINSTNKYIATFKNYDGTILYYEALDYGEIPSYKGVIPSKPSTAEYSYSFNGWDKEISEITSNVEYLATFASIKNSYTVTFKNYDGTILESNSFEYGSIPFYSGNTPIKEASAQYTYTFSGWNPNLSEVIDDITYLATFTKTLNKYTVTFKNYDNEVLYEVKVEYGSSATYIGENPSRDDEANKSYVFNKWSKSLSIIQEDTEVIALYITYDVYTFTYNDETIKKVRVLEGNEVSELIPSNTNTKISNNIETTYYWKKESDYQYIELTINRGIYYLTYELFNGTNNPENKLVIYADEEFTLLAASKVGYNFENWYTDENKTQVISKLSNVSSNLTLYADYSLIIYNIFYHLDGGNNAKKNPDTFSIEDEITLKDASKEGYSFIGWYLDASFENEISEIKDVVMDIDLYAKFEVNSYLLTFNNGATLTLKAEGYKDQVYYLNGGESIDLYSDSVLSLYDFENMKYFGGWYIDEALTTKFEDDSFSSDLTLYCSFNKINTNYSPGISLSEGLTLYPNYSGPYFKYYFVPIWCSSINISYFYPYKSAYNSANSMDITEIPEGNSGTYNRVFYIHRDRYDSYSANEVISVTPGAMLRIYIDYELGSSAYIKFTNLYKNSYYVSNNNISTSYIEYGSKINYVYPYDKKGYSFKNWAYENNNEFTDEYYNLVTDLTLHPTYNVVTYDINYHLDGGTNNQNNPKTYTIEDEFDLLDASKDGYSFVCWSTNNSSSSAISHVYRSYGTIELYAIFKANTYNISLDAKGGIFAPKVNFIDNNEIVRSIYLFEDDSTANYTLEKEGYIFAGWYLDESLTNVFNFNTTITKDCNLYAKWVACDKTIINIEEDTSFTLNINGKSEIVMAFTSLCNNSVTITSNSSLDLLGILYDANMVELIKEDDISEDDLDFSLTYEISAGNIYYLLVKGNTTTSIGEANILISCSENSILKGTSYQSMSTTYVYDTNYIFPDYVLKEGYTFLGWYDQNNNKVVSTNDCLVGDITLSAKWKINTYAIELINENSLFGSASIIEGSGIYNENITIKAAAYDQCYFDGWYSDANYNHLLSSESSYSFVMPANNVDIYVKFIDYYGYLAKIGILPNISSDSKYITYGLYPQSVVSDESLISNLDKLEDCNSYGYYTYESSYYYKMEAHPMYDDFTFNDGTAIIEGNSYWFKVEPIKWRIIDSSDGYTLLSDIVLDYQNFDGTSISNAYWNYYPSDIRNWLNNNFYNQAFFENNEYITQITNKNDASTSLFGNSYPEQFELLSDTTDYIYLLSDKDFYNSSYGFKTSASRGAYASDYAIALGVYYVNDETCNDGKFAFLRTSPYWTRSITPYYNKNGGGTYANQEIAYTGEASWNHSCNYSGVRPAMKIYYSF